MKKNKLYSAVLSVLLIVPGQLFCAEQPPVPQGILDRLYLSVPTMPAASQWLSNLTINVTSGFSSLSDKTKYLIYGAMAAFLGYIGYKAIFSSASASPTSNLDFETQRQVQDQSPDLRQLDSYVNHRNTMLIIGRAWIDEKGNINANGNANFYKKMFQEKVCPVLDRFKDELNTKEALEGFFKKIIPNTAARETYGLGAMSSGDVGFRLHQFIKQTCPNETITNPLKEWLIENNSNEKNILKILNQ